MCKCPISRTAIFFTGVWSSNSNSSVKCLCVLQLYFKRTCWHFLSPMIISKSYCLPTLLVEHHTAVVFDKDRPTCCPALSCTSMFLFIFLRSQVDKVPSASLFHDLASTEIFAVILGVCSNLPGLNLKLPEQKRFSFFLWEVVAHHRASHEDRLCDAEPLEHPIAWFLSEVGMP